jgi:threonylcarbamoyladenosine tRNA methylthiotransferase MtaB
MNRRYLTGEFRDKVALIREYFPDAAITTDIIVGYPTEEEENFLNTFNFAREIGFSNIHCFPYSPRKGTSSYNLPVHSKEVLGDRMRRIEAIRDELRNNYNRRFIGHPLKVLIEDREKGYNAGYSENYIRVYIDKITDSGKIIEITPNELLFDGLKG